MPIRDDELERVSLPDDRLDAIREMGRLTDDFLGERMDFVAYFPAISRLLGQFDPLDAAIEDLPAAAAERVRFFSEWTGGEFGESEHRIPRRAEWRYGIDVEPYAWVDVPGYRSALRSAYLQLQDRLAASGESTGRGP